MKKRKRFISVFLALAFCIAGLPGIAPVSAEPYAEPNIGKLARYDAAETQGHWEGVYGKDGYILMGCGYDGALQNRWVENGVWRGSIPTNSFNYDLASKPAYLPSYDYYFGGLHHAWERTDGEVPDMPVDSGKTKRLFVAAYSAYEIPWDEPGVNNSNYVFNISDNGYHQFTVYSALDSGSDTKLKFLQGGRIVFTDVIPAGSSAGGAYYSYIVKGAFNLRIEKEIATHYFATAFFFDSPGANATSGLTAADSGAGAYLEWSVSAPGAVALERRADGETAFTPIAVVEAGTTSYTDGGISLLDTYHYRLRSLDGKIASLPGAEADYAPPILAENGTELTLNKETYTLSKAFAPLTAVASLKDVVGAPLPGKTVRFVVKGDSGYSAPLGSAVTDENGEAKITAYVGVSGEFELAAFFDGDYHGRLNPSETAADLIIQDGQGEDDDFAEFYVSPDGDDGNDGSFESPYKTIEKARDVVRTINGNMEGNITVYLRGGEYNLSRAVELTQRDSGTNGYYINYVNYPGETPVISGAETIDGWAAEGNLLKTNIGGKKIRELFVNGARAQRARSGYYPVVRWDKENLLIDLDSSVVAGWDGLDPNMEMVIVQHWTRKYFRLNGYFINGGNVRFEPETNKAAFFYAQTGPAKEVGLNVYFENSLRYLDRPGEWCLDESSGDLYYYPLEGETPGNINAVTPQTETLMRLQGAGIGNRIKNVKISGITFEYTKWQYNIDYNGLITTQADWIAYPSSINGRPTALMFINYADGVIIERNVVRHTGNIGIDLLSYSDDCQIIGNVVTDIGSNGIMAGRFSEGKEQTVNRLRIKNNYIKSASVTSSGTGIACGHLTDSFIEHNEVSDCAYTGITAGWTWDDRITGAARNSISYNNIYYVCHSLSDGAGIYTLGNAPNSQIAANFIHDIDRSEWSGDSSAACIYPDEGSSGYTIRDNVYRRVGQIFWGFYYQNNPINNDGQDQGTVDNAGIEPEYADIIPTAVKITGDWVSRGFVSVVISGKVTSGDPDGELDVSIVKNGGEVIWSGKASAAEAALYHKNIDVAKGDVISFKASKNGLPAEDAAVWDGLVSVEDYPPVLDMDISFSADQLGVNGDVIKFEKNYFTKRIQIRVHEDVDVTRLIPTITTPHGTVVSPASGSTVDFSQPVVFTVMLEEGSDYADFDGGRKFKHWTVVVLQKEAGLSGIRGVNINSQIADADNWHVTGGTKAAAEDSVAFTEGMAAYLGNTFQDELLEFNVTMSGVPSEGWPSITFRLKNDAEIWAGGNEGYIICVKPDQIELQRFNNGVRTVFYGNILGESPSKFGDSVPNNLFTYDEEHLVQVGAVNVEGGVRLLFFVDGTKVFDCIDNFEGYITAPGYLGTHQFTANTTVKIGKTPVITDINGQIADADGWVVTGGTKRAAADSVSFTEGIAAYMGNTFQDELLEFNMTISNVPSGGWPSLTFRLKNNSRVDAAGNEGYIIVVKEDQIELQRFNNGARTVFYGNVTGETPAIYGDSVPNNLFTYGEEHLVRVGAVNAENGVRLLFYVDGVKVFDCIDSYGGRVTSPGYFGTHQLSPGITVKLGKTIVIRTVNDQIADADNWHVTNGTKTVSDYSVAFTEGMAAYLGEKFRDELLEFNMTISGVPTGGWPSITFRLKNDAEIWAGGNEGYIICVKEDQIELQRFNDGVRTVFYGNILGESPSKYGDSAPNNLFTYEEEHHVHVGAVNVEGGVRLLFYVDGIKIFDCIDNFEGYITSPGYLGTHQMTDNTTIKLSKIQLSQIPGGGTAISCAVTFDANGGAFAGGGTISAQVVNKGGEAVPPAAPSRDGYDFGGWFTAAEGGERVTVFTGITRDTAYYAHWSASLDTAELEELIGRAGNLNRGAYKAASLAVIDAALAEAEAVLAAVPGVTQERIDGAAAALKAALDAKECAALTCAVKSVLAKVAKLQRIPFGWDGLGEPVFATSNAAVCGVTQDGTLIPMKAGIAVITITAPNGDRALFAVTVSA